MKILNLYACLGGNRYKWGEGHEITAVELDPELARLYKERFPNDTVIVAMTYNLGQRKTLILFFLICLLNLGC